MMEATGRSIIKSWAGEEVPLSCGSLPDWGCNKNLLVRKDMKKQLKQLAAPLKFRN